MANPRGINQYTKGGYGQGGPQTRKAAKRHYAGAAVIKKVSGGYKPFATLGDYKTWKKQK